MKKAAVALSLLLAFSLLSGCGLAYQINRNGLLKSANESDYGPPPPDNHQEIEAQTIRTMLKDPGSAQFEFGGMQRDAIQSGFASPTPILVWRTFVRVNSKNSFGGYTGFSPYHVAWRDGRIIAVAPPLVTLMGPTDGLWQYLR
jgi:hypothetical protein